MAGAYAVRAAGGWGSRAIEDFFVNWVYDTVTVTATALCAWRAVSVDEERKIWSLIAVAFGLELTGNLLETALYGTSTAPVPSVADAFWLGFYVPMIIALALRVRSAAGAAGPVILDALIATCALGALSAAFVLDPILAGGSGSPAALATALAYPVGDLVLVALVLQLAAANGWRLGRGTRLMAGCFVVLAVTDTIFAFQTARGTYVAGGLLDLGWLVPYALFGVAAWSRPERLAPVAATPTWRALGVPVGSAMVVLGLVVYGGVAHVNETAVGLSTAALVFVLARFVVTFRRYVAALAKTRLILETARDTFISFDATGRIVEWNPQAQATFGWRREEVVGHDLAATIIPEHRRDAHRLSIARFLESSGGELLGDRVERIVVHRDGREFPVEQTVSPLETESGWEFNVFMRDITDRRRAQEELAQARDEALEASRMKSSFVANMSHEIRTPMNGVIGIADLLLGTDLDPQQAEFVETISASGEVLLELIDHILDLSKIEAGKIELDAVDFDLGDAIERACGMLAARADEKRLELVVAVDPGLPSRLHGDAARLRQVITNFVSNAIKFTAAGEIVVAASAISTTAGVADIRLEVSDTGIGIEPETLAHLFTPFSQADASTTRKYGGTGLGLAISRQLVELMGGRVGVDSRRGEGSRFWFELALPVAPPLDERPDADDVGGLRVLVVDDNASTRSALARTLGSWRLDCDVAADAREAVDQVDAAIVAGVPYGLALIDLEMPGLDGSAAGRMIRAKGSTDALRLVALKPAGGRLDGAEDAGVFDGSLTKPVPRDRLRDEVGKAIVGDRTDARPQAKPSPTQRRAEQDAAPTGPCVLVVEDTEVNQVVAALMLRRAGFRSQLAANGVEALDALSRGSFAAALMDCQMPELDGYETTREIRRREAGGPRMPIIAMTANSMAGERERCLAAGMDDYLTKPLRDRSLQDSLARWIADPRAEAPGASAAASEGTAPTAAAPEGPALASAMPVGAGGRGATDALLDDAILTELDRLDPEMLTSLVSLYSAQAAGNIAELAGAVDRGDVASVAQTAHKLRGSSASIGALAVSRLAGTLETSATAGDLTGGDSFVGDLRDRLAETLSEFDARGRPVGHAETGS